MSELSKISDFIDKIEFENDWGEAPILLGRLTTDKAVIGVGTAALMFVGWTIAQLPLAAVVALIAVNDFMAIEGGGKRKKQGETPIVVDTEAEEIRYEEDELDDEEGGYQEAPRNSQSSKQATKSPYGSKPVYATPGAEIGDEFEEDAELEQELEPERSPRQKASRPPDSVATSPPLLPAVTDRSKKEVIRRLKEECPGLLKLVKSHPVRAVGKQRTGKSTLVKKLGLLRMILLKDHQVIASTPHYEPANPYPAVFKTVGITADNKRDYPSIRKEWAAMAQRVHEMQISSITTVWDEFGLLNKVMDEEDIKSVLTSTLRETMKFGEYPIFIVHGETAAFLPGSKGLVTPFLEGTVRVETIGELVEDEDGLETVRPTGKFNITWLDGSKESGQIPDWLTESYLLNLLGNPVVNHSEPKTIEQPIIANPVTSGLKEPLPTLLRKAKEHGDWITVREIQRLNTSALQGKTAKQVHEYLGLLADIGLGEIDEENKSDSAVKFRSL
jgi:hypothetical protein